MALLPAAVCARPLSLDAAIRRAWANDPATAPLELGAELARAHEVQAGIRPNPTVELHTSAAMEGGGEWSAGVGLSQELPRRQRVELARSLARLGGEAVALQVWEQRLRTAGEVRRRYYHAVIRAAHHDAAARAVGEMRDVFALVERRRAAGEVPDTELEILRVEMERANQALARATLELDLAQHQLRQVMYATAEEAVVPALDLDSLIRRDVAQLVPTAEESRPEIALAVHAVKEAQVALEIAEAARRADWTIGAGIEFERRANDVTGRLVNEPRINFSASIPWGRGGAGNRGIVLEKQAAKRIAEAQRDARQRSLAAEAMAALAAVRSLQALLQTQRELLLAQEPVPAVLRAAFDRGEITNLQLAQVRQQRIAMENDFLETAARYAAALAEAETSLGMMPTSL